MDQLQKKTTQHLKLKALRYITEEKKSLKKTQHKHLELCFPHFNILQLAACTLSTKHRPVCIYPFLYTSVSIQGFFDLPTKTMDWGSSFCTVSFSNRLLTHCFGYISSPHCIDQYLGVNQHHCQKSIISSDIKHLKPQFLFT